VIDATVSDRDRDGIDAVVRVPSTRGRIGCQKLASFCDPCSMTDDDWQNDAQGMSNGIATSGFRLQSTTGRCDFFV